MGTLVDAGGVELWVEQRGAGQMLYCCPASATRTWRGRTSSSRSPAASASRRSTTEGSEGSTLPDGPFTVRDMADDTIRVIERLGIKPVHLAGFSMGGAIAQELAITRPDLVASLVLVGTWCRTDPFQYELFESWKREAVAAASDEQFARALVLWIYSRRAFADGSIKKWVSQMLAVPQPQSTDAFIRTIDAIQAHDTADRLGSILAPTLVIGGDSDLICPADGQSNLAARIPGAQLELLSGEAHQPFQEAPEEFDRSVLAFLKTT